MPLSQDSLTGFVGHADCSRHDTGWNHPDHQGRLAGMLRAVHMDMLTLHDSLLEVEAVPATREDLEMVHDASYIDAVRARVAESEAGGQPIPFGDELVVSGASYEAGVAAVGAVLSGIEAVVSGDARNAFCATRPPGQGAGRSSQTGFSLFNSIAVGAKHLLNQRGLDRVLIVEYSAEPGRGTAEIIADEPRLRMLSIHQRPTSPVTWPANAVAIALEAGSSADEVDATLRQGFERVTDGFEPDFVLLSLGFDLLSSDPIGEIDLNPSDYYPMTRAIVELADRACDGRLVSALEGGYDPRASGQALVQHLRALTGLDPA